MDVRFEGFEVRVRVGEAAAARALTQRVVQEHLGMWAEPVLQTEGLVAERIPAAAAPAPPVVASRPMLSGGLRARMGV